MISDASTASEWRRHESVIDRIVELRAETAARAVKIVLPDPKPSGELPDGVSLQPAVLTISFENDQQLLERLFLLAASSRLSPRYSAASAYPSSHPLSHELVWERHFSHELLRFFAGSDVLATRKSWILRRLFRISV
jgi:hypothetical protein